jgi:hypothetical protein
MAAILAKSARNIAPGPLIFLLTESPSAATSDRCGWFSGWRRADSLIFCRPGGLTD